MLYQVSLTTTLQISVLLPAHRRSGSNGFNLYIEKALKMYKYRMDGVDRNHQYGRGDLDLLNGPSTNSVIRKPVPFLILWF